MSTFSGSVIGRLCRRCRPLRIISHIRRCRCHFMHRGCQLLDFNLAYLEAGGVRHRALGGDELFEEMLKRGDGSRALLFIKGADDVPGHVVNVVNVGGSVKFLDGQAGIQELAGNATMLYYMSEEAQEGRNAYNERRKPDFARFPWRP